MKSVILLMVIICGYGCSRQVVDVSEFIARLENNYEVDATDSRFIGRKFSDIAEFKSSDFRIVRVLFEDDDRKYNYRVYVVPCGAMHVSESIFSYIVVVLTDGSDRVCSVYRQYTDFSK